MNVHPIELNFDPKRDWFSNNIPAWEAWLAPLAGRAIRALEIGSFQGRSACWLIQRVLGRDSKLVCVEPAVRAELRSNIGQVAHAFGVEHVIIPLFSRDYWTVYPPHPSHALFDFIYIDGSHTERDVLRDSVAALDRLERGGIIVWDDYLWTPGADEPDQSAPRAAIDAAISAWRDELVVLEDPPGLHNPGWQKAARRKS